MRFHMRPKPANPALKAWRIKQGYTPNQDSRLAWTAFSTVQKKVTLQYLDS